MPFAIVALALFAALMEVDADAETEREQLAEMFSPILILTEETGGKWGDIIVTKPEPVDIMGAQSAENLHFKVSSALRETKPRDVDSYLNWDPPLGGPKVSFSQNRFAFFANGFLYQGDPPGDIARGSHIVGAYFDFSGKGTTRWNAEYEAIGENFPNTAYVHIYQRVVEGYRSNNPVTVIQYFYFYPYNDWWNKHEGDWQRIDVVVSSSDPDTATILGVEYRFHGAWLNYYKDWHNRPGLTTNFVFNPRTAVKLSPGPRRNGLVQYTHPIVYVGAGSHGGFPIGGKIQIYHTLLGLLAELGREVVGGVGGDYEYMTHTGLVLATQAPASGSSLWERYRLKMLPEPDPKLDNMGLDPEMSWLGARIQWGTPDVGGIGISKSPYGPYNSDSDDWGELEFFEVGETGPDWVPDVTPYEMHHRDLPYDNYHHWAILGDETWSGTVSLSGDVVVFPGASLTIDAGTTIEFQSRSDRHQFKKGNHRYSEIFVYGTLTAEGASDKPIVFQRTGRTSASAPMVAWGGIRKMDGGTVAVNDYTRALDARPLTVSFGSASYEVSLGVGEESDRSVTVIVEMTPSPILRAVTIPVTVMAGDAESGDYTVRGLGDYTVKGQTGEGTLTFAVDERRKGFTITAHPDTDPDYEHLGLGFGPLPEGVVAGEPATAAVTIEDEGTVPPKPTEGLSVTTGQGQLTVHWALVSAEPSVTGYGLQYQHGPGLGGPREWSSPELLPALDSKAESYTHRNLTATWFSRYRYQLRASNDRGDGAWSGYIPNAGGAFPLPPRVAILELEVLRDVSKPKVVVDCPSPLPCDRFEQLLTTERFTLEWRKNGEKGKWQSFEGVQVFEVFGGSGTRPERVASGVTMTARRVAALDNRKQRRNQHQFEVRLVNAAGEAGEASEPVGLIPLQAVAGAGLGEVALSWEALEGPVTVTGWAFRVRSAVPSWGPWQSVPGGSAATAHTVPALPPGVEYEFQVRAVHEEATRAASFTVSATPAGPPSAPRQLTAARGDGQVALKWKAPAQDGSSAITGYEYRQSADGGATWDPDWGPIPGSDAETKSDTLESLTNGIRYVFEIRAVNGLGAGASKQVDAKPAGLPSAPGEFEAEAGDGQVMLSWAAADSNGSRIKLYQVRRYRADKAGRQAGWKDVPGRASARRDTVTGLLNDTEYVFEVRARNVVGNGPPADTTATPQAGNEPPVITGGPAAVSFPEHVADTVATYAATDPDEDPITWSLSGVDADTMRIDSAGRLRFRSAPDYEAPGDKDKDRIYRVSVVASDGALSSRPQRVAVTVQNVDEPGTVRIALPEDAADPAGPPQVGHRLQATVTDPDGGVEPEKWEWQRQPFAGGPFEVISKSTASAYTVQEADVCHRLRVTVTYTDNHGEGKSAQSPDGAARVIHTPGSPPNLTALAGDEAVTLSWDEASGHCSAITHYQSRHRPRKDEATGTWVDEWTAWATVAIEAGQAEALARSQEVTGLANGRRYSFSVRAVNGAGEGMAWTVSATPMASGPVVLGPDTTKVGERHAGVVATFKVAEKHATWASLAGADHARFTLTRQVGAADTVLGLVQFKKVPNYEGPDDHDHDREYELQIVARSGAERSAPHSFVVVVENRRDPGFITLAPPRPRPGQTFVATLADEDGGVVGKPKWMWTGGQPVDAVQGGQTVSLHAESRRATSADVGKRIRVKARYVDNFGADSAMAVTDTILGKPEAPPNLTGTRGDREVTLRWDPAPDGGSEIQHYEWRRQRGTGWTEWTELPPPQPSAPPPRTVTVTGLTNGTAYTFEVRAENDIGEGPASSVTATPATVPEAPPNFQASPGNARVTLTWGEAANGGDAITHYETRHRRSDRTAWGSWSTVGGNAAARSRTISSLTNGQKYAFQVRAENGVGAGAAADTLATPVAPRPQITGPDTVRVDERHTGAVASFQVTGGPPGAATWNALGGADRAAFTLTGGVLRFKKAPDYEAPGDQDRDHDFELEITAQKGTRRSEPHDVVVVVRNIDDPGFITLAPPRPRPGQSFLATLADTDGGVTKLNWSWTGGAAVVQGGQGPSLHAKGRQARSADVGQRIRVTATYDDNHGPGKSASAVTDTILDVPEAPPDFKASSGDRQVTLTWGEAANGGDAITHYETRYRRSDDQWSDTWSTVGGGAGARRRTISPLTNGQGYVFQVRAENGVGDGAAAEAPATPVAPRPQITGPDTTKVGERHVGVVDTFKVADPGGRVTWEPLAGRDGAKFTLTRQVVVGAVLGLVEFKKAPDYEAPDDHDHDREYEVRIVARRGTLRSAAHDFVAVVENRDDPGTITLSPSAPRIGETVTATLVDTDSGVRDTVWTWPRHGGVSGQQYPSIRTSKEKVGRNDLGKRLRATVTYTDNHGSGKSASATTQDVRANKPGPVGSLTASRGNGQVTLTWTAAANNGASIDYYEYRQGTSGSFSRIGSGHTARNARSKTVTGLTNGTSYTFQVRAHNAVGDGPAVSVTATPATRPGVPPSFRATPGNARVALTWGAAASGGDAITHYETRHRRSDRTAWGSWSTVSGGAGARSRTISSLTNGQGYVFQVRAENGVGDGAAAEAPATPVAPNRAPTVSGPATPSVPENGAKKVATYTLSDPDAGDALSWRPLGGAQASAFELKPLSPPQARKRELHFRSTPNHEARERYAVKVIGRDRAGRTDTLAVTVTVTDVNERPSVSGSATAQVPERTKKVGTYTGSDPDGDALTWSVRGDDGSRFELKQLSPPNARKRELHFKSTPYYNGSDYSAAVRVEDPDGLAASQSVEVEVTDVDDRGSVSLSPSSPRVGQTVTATLIDTDGGVRDTSWTWTRHGGIGGQQYPSIRTSKEKVGRNDLGKQLRATVTYTDNHGEGKSATAITNAVKANRPGPVGTLTASGGDGRVTLSWTAAANNGSSIDYYEYRQGTSGSFSRIGSGHTARNARSKTVTGLTNGTAYTFQVRAHNAVGSGPAVSAKATPAGKPSAPKSLSAARGDRQATLTWGAADANGSAVTHYEYRRMREGGAAWSSWFTISGGGSTRSRTMTGLTNGTGYTFQIRAENGAGAGPAASVTVTPAGRPGAPKNLTTARPGTRKVSITWTAADDNGSPITAYQYRRRAGASTTWRGWFTVSGGGSARTRTVSGLGDFTQYTWEVRAKNDIGYGPSASVVTSPRGPGGPAGQGGGEPDNEGDNEGEPDTPMEDGGPSAKPVALGDGGGELAVTTAPNPFNDTTTLRLQLPEAARVLLTLHNLAGQVVAVLVDAELAAGTHVREWDGRDDRGRASASGLYLYRLLAGQRILTGKLALIR